jgi:hypothetical protein
MFLPPGRRAGQEAPGTRIATGRTARSARDHHRLGPADRGRRLRPGPDLENHYTIRSPTLFGQTLGIHNAAEFFIMGAMAGAILLLGIAMILAGLRRKGAKAKQHRADRKEARNAGRDRDKAQEENDELRRQLDHDAGARSSGATAAE